MAYNNYFPTGYQPAQIVYPQAQQTQQNSNGIIWVSGEAGAKAYLVAPNQSVQLWDSESQTIYLKSADAAGIPNMRILDYTFRDSVPQARPGLDVGGFASKEDVDYLKEELKALKAKLESEEGKESKKK